MTCSYNILLLVIAATSTVIAQKISIESNLSADDSSSIFESETDAESQIDKFSSNTIYRQWYTDPFNGIFSVKLYDALSYEEGNVLMSPLSLSHALTALSLGARGNTLKELRQLLNQSDDRILILSSYESLTRNLMRDQNLTLISGIYLNTTIRINEEFEKDVRSIFDAEVENVDFAGRLEESRTIINKYVSKKTKRFVRGLLSKGSIFRSTSAIVVNSIYFKGLWAYPFNKISTRKKTFYGRHGEYEVDMMVRPATSTRYADDEDLDIELLELPFEGKYSFLIILPKDKQGIQETEDNILLRANYSSSLFIDIFDQMEFEDVEVHLPKFGLETTHYLVEPLQEMGLNDAFTESANFERLSDTEFSINEVIQKISLEINEAGTQAGAVKGTSLSSRGSYKKFTVDHPFLFVIIEESLKSPLLIGRFELPSSSVIKYY